MNDYLEMKTSITLSNWIESLVRIGRCALKEKLYYHALNCFNHAFKEKIPTNINSPSYKNKYDANICFYWTSIGYFECANVYQEYIKINYIITDIPTMHLDSINYLVESTKYLRVQSNVSYELLLEISKRAWNISLQLLKYKETYKTLEKLLYELVFLTNRITTEQKQFKEYFKNPDNQIVNIFSHIFSLLLELNLLNNNWTSGLHIISKLNALLPINVDNNCYLEKLQFFYHTNNEMGLNSLFTNKPELQLFYWTNIACMKETKKEQAEHAYKICIDLCEDPIKKAEYIIKYIDWMNTNKINHEEYFNYLCMAWDLIDSTISNKVKEINNQNSKGLFVDENKLYSVYQVELLVRSFILYSAIYHTKKNTLNCILTVYNLLKNTVINTHKTAILLQTEYKRKKNKKNQPDNNEDEDGNKKTNNKKKKSQKVDKKEKDKQNDVENEPLETESGIESETIKDYYYVSSIPELPDNIKNWPKYVWPNAMINMLEDSDSDSILINRNIKSCQSLISAIYYAIEECISLLRYNYVYFFLWLIDLLINNYISSNEQYIIKCINYALDFHIFNKLNEKGISFNRYYSLIKHFSVISINFDEISKENICSIEKLDIYNDFPFDNNINLIKIIEIFILNKEIVDVNKMKSIILQVEEKSPVKNETMMSDLIYCKLIINDYLNSSDFSEKEYVDLCKIGLNLNTNIKMKYRIATCYLKFLCKHSCSFEEFEKAGQYTLGILKDSGCSDDWYTHVIIGKFHQDIGIILGNLTLKCDDQNKIFKLAYQHFNDGLSIFNLYKLYYNKAFLIVDYIKVIYCHLFYNKIWSKNLLLICLSLIKESHLALDYYKNNPDFTDIIETTEFKNCVDLITILEIELYIIINKFENITLYDTNDSIKHMISNYIIDSYIPTEINEKYEFIKNISIEEAKNICLSLKEYLNKSNSKNIHILFLYGIIQCLNPEKEEQSVVDLNNIIFKKTLKIGDYYNKEQKNNDSLIKSTSCFLDLKLSSDEEEYFMKFFNNWDL
eukprot:jgi/Orpsp1_1/1179307/evm.model.c7180000068838.1